MLRFLLFILLSLCWSLPAFAKIVTAGPVRVTGPVTVSDYDFFSDGFETGDFSKWLAAFNASINSTAPFVHAGAYSAKMTYDGGENAWAHHFKTGGYTHFFVREYFYFKTPEVGGEPSCLRKIFQAAYPDMGQPAPNWILTLGSDFGTPGSIYVNVSSDGGCGVTNGNWYTGVTLSFDTWYEIQLEVQDETPGVGNGYLKLWWNGAVEGSPTWTQTGLTIGGTCGGLPGFQFGKSTLPLSGVSKEFHYLDDVVISPNFIGP